MKPIALLLALAVTAPLFALDAVLTTAQYNTVRCSDVALQLTSDAASTTLARAAFPHARTELEPEHMSNQYDFHVKLPDKGLTRVAVDLEPITRELTPRQVETYLDEIGATDEVRAAWKEHPGRWREITTQHAKTMLRCGTNDIQSVATETDMGAELIPQGTDPTMLKAGDKMTVIMIRRVKSKTEQLTTELVRNAPLVLLREDGSRVTVTPPNASGVLSVVVPTPGRYVLRETQVRPGDGKDADWISDTATLSFAVE